MNSTVVAVLIFLAVGIVFIAMVVWARLQLSMNEQRLEMLRTLTQAAVEAAECTQPDGDQKNAYVRASVLEAAQALNVGLSDDEIDQIVMMLLESSVFMTFKYVPEVPLSLPYFDSG